MTEATRIEAPAPARFDPISFLARFAPLIFLIVLMAVFAIAEPTFLTSLNIFNVLRQVSIYGLLAIGMTFVILTAGIDLSVGSLVAFSGVIATSVLKYPFPPVLAFGAALVSGLMIGALSGLFAGIFITKFRITPFIVTLALMTILR